MLTDISWRSIHFKRLGASKTSQGKPSRIHLESQASKAEPLIGQASQGGAWTCLDLLVKQSGFK